MKWAVLFLLALSLVVAQECIPTEQRDCPSVVQCGCGGTYNQYWETSGCPQGQGYCVQSTQCTYNDEPIPTSETSCTDGIDNDCNDLTDCEEPSCSTNAYCIDADGDGFSQAEDCNDNDASIKPGAQELCDNQDNNCNGQVDETFNLQTDVNNCGQCNNKIVIPNAIPACQNGVGVMQSCIQGYYDLDNNQVNGCEYACTPSGEEICDNKDNDCDGSIDEDLTCTQEVLEQSGEEQANTTSKEITTNQEINNTPSSLQPVAKLTCIDQDGDGFGEGCPAGPDCDDNNKQIYPGAQELCDNKDNNCNNQIDEALTRSCGIDIGICQVGQEICRQGEWVGCTATQPLEKEICYDQLDNTCDGRVDEGCPKLNKKEQFLQTLKKDSFEDALAKNRAEEGRFYHVETQAKIIGDTTRVEISLIPHEKKLRNAVIYHKIPKDVAQSTDDITFLHSNDVKLEIIEKDPVIAWHIAEVEEKTVIAYEVEGAIEDIEEKVVSVVEVESIEDKESATFLALLPLLLIPILALTLIAFAKFARKH
ncbi:hypothetical protein D6774_00420 [Candidatus Woesearchaeota archaeon]|nr:MAG: hypothetical protein D6774_00420 [Candidatus Woesearchaeota archaeon]